MQSLERYIVKLISEFFFFKTTDEEEDFSKSLHTFISNNSNIHFDGLATICKKEKSGFYISVTCKCLSLKMNYEMVANV